MFGQGRWAGFSCLCPSWCISQSSSWCTGRRGCKCWVIIVVGAALAGFTSSSWPWSWQNWSLSIGPGLVHFPSCSQIALLSSGHWSQSDHSATRVCVGSSFCTGRRENICGFSELVCFILGLQRDFLIRPIRLFRNPQTFSSVSLALIVFHLSIYTMKYGSVLL